MTESVASHETALIVDQFGTYVSKHSERLRVLAKKEIVAEAPPR